MKSAFVINALLMASNAEEFQTRIDRKNPGHRRSTGPTPSHITAPLPTLNGELPKQWIWDNINGTNYLTTVKQQHLPEYCGSCWAQAATSSMSDRIKIMRKNAWPEINIAPQVLLSCSMNDFGCGGGDAISGFKYIHENGITDETCAIYRGRGHTNGVDCAPMVKCMNCNPSGPCFMPDSYKTYGIEQYGPVTGEAAIMQEVYQRGPVACGIAVPESLEKYTGGIYEDTTGDMSIVHDISIVGYGEENGKKYWTVRNSWGTHWGEQGFFRVVRGIDNIAIESNCSFAVPKDTWTDEAGLHQTTDDEKTDPANKPFEANGGRAAESAPFLGPLNYGRVPKAFFPSGEKGTTPRSWTLNADLPAAIDWRNKGGVNYLSWNKNQHIPEYCGSCWAQGSTSSIADRFNIMNDDQTQAPVALSAQVIVNCQAGGSCNGGNPGGVYEFAYNNGIPHVTCEQYVAHNLDDGHAHCEPIDLCRDCVPPFPKKGEDLLKNCHAVDYKKYYVSDYFEFSGIHKMKTELATHGPISCGIQATPEFEKYDGKSIYSQNIMFPSINHEIAVVGYGTDEKTGESYWIGRNSWGTYWGEYGFFYMKMGSDNLGIETDCTAGIPTYTKPSGETPTI